MNLFVFYPDTYVRRCNDSVLFIDLHSGEYLLEKDNTTDVSEYHPWFEITQDSQFLADKCSIKKLGYVLKCSTIPFIQQKRIHVVSSIHRTAELMKFSEGFHIKDLLCEIHILTHNTTYQAPFNFIYAQIEYPTWGDTACLPVCVLSDLAYTSPPLSVVISGDLNSYLTSCLMPFVSSDKYVTIRTYGNHKNMDKAIALLTKFPQIRLEVLVDSIEMLSYIKNIFKKNFLDRIVVTFLIKDINELDAFTQCSYKAKTFIPILYDATTQQSIVDEMLLDIDDIVKSPTTSLEVYKKQKFHPNNYGSLLLDSKGNVFDWLSCIGNLHETDFYTLLNKNLHSSKCSWYMTRRKWNSCKYCVFADICPALSIYEVQGIIPCACKNRPINLLGDS